jgi:hypothetical protein
VKAAAGETPATSPAATQQFEATLSSGANGWTAILSATPLRLGPGADLTVSGEASPTSYSFTVAGEASTAQLESILHAFPQLADDSGLVLGGKSMSADAIRTIALSCTRMLSGGQTCSAPAPPPRRPARRNPRRR